MTDPARVHLTATHERSAVPTPVRRSRPLDATTRAAMEPRFGRDFSQVRVHTDAGAAESARSIGAVAYTVGHDVVFGAGRYAPGTGGGDRLLAHELAHVVQQENPVGVGRADAAAEGRARAAADTVVRGGAVPPGLVGRAPLGVAADDGKDSGGPGLSSSSKVGRGSLVGPLKISAQIVDDLRRWGLLRPEMVALIESGRVVMEPDPAKPPAPRGDTGGTRDFASELNLLPGRFGLLGTGPVPPKTFGGSVSAPLARSLVVGGYKDPKLGYIPPFNAKYSEALRPEENWLNKLVPDLKATFGMFEGVTISNISRPGVSTNIFVSGITQKLGTAKGFSGQVELGWDRTVGFQLSRSGWFLHGEANPSGAWGFSLSFPGEAGLPVLPWMNNIFREGAVAVEGLIGMAARGVPNPDQIGPLVKEAGPHITRMKNAVDAAKGIAGTKPGLNFSVSLGSGPPAGVTPAEKPSGFFIGGTLVGSF